MSVTVVGEHEFIDIFLYKWPPDAPPILWVANDINSAAETLKESEGPIVVGFTGNNGLEFAQKMAETYCNRRFFLAVEEEVLSDVSFYRQVTGKGIVPVSSPNAAEEVAAKLPGAGSPRREPEPDEVINQVGEEIAAEACRAKTANKLSLACWSTRGGVGKTATSVNLAVELAKWGKKVKPNEYRVCLVDGDAAAGNLRYWLGSPEPRVTLPAWLDLTEEGKVSWNMVREYLMYHHKSGLYYLPRSSRASDAAYITPELMEKTHRILTMHFDAVIYDLDASLDEKSVNKTTLDVLSRVRTILVLSRSDLPTIKSINDDLKDMIPNNGLDLSKMRLVINRFHNGSEFNSKEIAQYINVPLFIPILPEDQHIDQAVNHGIPPVLAYPDCDFSKAIAGIARNLVGHEIWGKNELKSSWVKRLTCLFKGRAATV